MLTYDDLDHFDERTMAGLFDPAVAAREQAETQRRRERILACLRFCRDIPSAELRDDGVRTARRLLRRALRRHERAYRPEPVELGDFLEGALAALGEAAGRPGESIEAAALRQVVEREMESAARSRRRDGTAVPALLEAMARGDFEIAPGSRVAALGEAAGRFNGEAEVEIRLQLDDGGEDLAPSVARVRLSIVCGLWRWSAGDGCSIAFDDGEPQAIAAGDELLPVLLAGLSVQGGRAVTLWAAAVEAAAEGAGRLN